MVYVLAAVVVVVVIGLLLEVIRRNVDVPMRRGHLKTTFSYIALYRRGDEYMNPVNIRREVYT